MWYLSNLLLALSLKGLYWSGKSYKDFTCLIILMFYLQSNKYMQCMIIDTAWNECYYDLPVTWWLDSDIAVASSVSLQTSSEIEYAEITEEAFLNMSKTINKMYDTLPNIKGKVSITCHSHVERHSLL